VETLLPGEITAGNIISDVLGAFLTVLAVLAVFDLDASFFDNLAGIIDYCPLCVPFVDIDSEVHSYSLGTLLREAEVRL
jgi:hypothetical protein